LGPTSTLGTLLVPMLLPTASPFPLLGLNSHTLTLTPRLLELHRVCFKRTDGRLLILRREKVAEFLEYLSGEDVPLLIFSAGLANVLKEFLTMHSVFHPNIHVVSNKLNWDDEGNLLPLEGELIHTMNKNGTVLKTVATDWAHNGKNVLLVRPTLSIPF